MANKNEVKGIRNRGTQPKAVKQTDIEAEVIAEDLTHLTQPFQGVLTLQKYKP
jgi:hypothetical protein